MGWLITLGILVILAWLPLGATVRYNDQGVSLKVIAGPVRIPILPKKKAQEKEKPNKEEKNQEKAACCQEIRSAEAPGRKGRPGYGFSPPGANGAGSIKCVSQKAADQPFVFEADHGIG